MPLIDPLPSALESELEEAIRAHIVEAVVSTDLDIYSRFCKEWLVVYPRHIEVISQAKAGYEVRLELDLADVEMVEVEGLIGGGALVAIHDEQRVEILRYSNANQRKFSTITQYINEVIQFWKSDKTGSQSETESNGARVDKPEGFPEIVVDETDQKNCPNCGLLLPDGTTVCPSCMSKGKAIRRVLMYLNPHKRSLVFICCLMIIGIVLTLIPTYLTEPLTDRVLNPVEPSTMDERISLLGWLVVILLAAQFTGVGLGILKGRLTVKLAGKLSYELRQQVFSHLQNLSLSYFDKRQAGSLISRVTRDTRALEQVLVQSIQSFFSNILLFIGIGLVLFWMNWKLTLLVFIPAPLVLFISRFFWRRLKNVWRRYWHFYSRVTASVSDSLSGIRVIRAFAKEDVQIQRFDKRSVELRDSFVSAEYLWETFFPVVFFIMGIGNLIVWYVGGYQVIEDSVVGQSVLPTRDVFTLGQFFVFLGYLRQFYAPLQFMSRLSDYLSRALAAAERVFEVLDTDFDVKDAQEPVSMTHIKGDVSFKNVTFGYESHKPILKDLSFDVKAGEMIGLVGRSGAGKSTTINLICRFYEVLEGAILIDGVNIKDIPQKDLRSQIGVVLQEPFLFSGSIYENISFARPDASREDIMAAAKAANAHDFIIKKADGYDTQVGERGQTLSGGERQRISIARAILHNPRILILDEATASVDTDTEKQIQEAIARLIQGRTTFAIAHRLSTLRNASRLVVLKDGKLEEIGTHEELIAEKGEFYRLVEIQQEMNKIFEVV